MTSSEAGSGSLFAQHFEAQRRLCAARRKALSVEIARLEKLLAEEEALEQALATCQHHEDRAEKLRKESPFKENHAMPCPPASCSIDAGVVNSVPRPILRVAREAESPAAPKTDAARKHDAPLRRIDAITYLETARAPIATPTPQLTPQLPHVTAASQTQPQQLPAARQRIPMPQQQLTTQEPVQQQAQQQSPQPLQQPHQGPRPPQVAQPMAQSVVPPSQHPSVAPSSSRPAEPTAPRRDTISLSELRALGIVHGLGRRLKRAFAPRWNATMDPCEEAEAYGASAEVARTEYARRSTVETAWPAQPWYNDQGKLFAALVAVVLLAGTVVILVAGAASSQRNQRLPSTAMHAEAVAVPAHETTSSTD